MSSTVLVALLAATPPTAAAVLTFLAARASDKRGSIDRAAVTAKSIDQLGGAVARVEGAVERIEGTLTDIRERVARLEGGRQPIGDR
jgi:hypothetical protein